MAKKKSSSAKPTGSTSVASGASAGTTSATHPAPAAEPAAIPAAPADPGVAHVEALWRMGNFSALRKLAATSPDPHTQQAAQARLPLVRIEPAQVMVGIIAVLVSLTAAALTLSFR